jgi:hypothetical protein
MWFVSKLRVTITDCAEEVVPTGTDPKSTKDDESDIESAAAYEE